MVLTIINAVTAILVLYFSNASWIEVFFNGEVGDSSSNKFGIIAGLLALAVVVTTILQFMKRWGERSDVHKLAGAEFSNLQRKTERYLLVKNLNMAMIHNLNRDYNHATKIYPLVNMKIWSSCGGADLDVRIAEFETSFRTDD